MSLAMAAVVEPSTETAGSRQADESGDGGSGGSVDRDGYLWLSVAVVRMSLATAAAVDLSTEMAGFCRADESGDSGGAGPVDRDGWQSSS